MVGRSQGEESFLFAAWHMPAILLFYFVLPIVLAVGYCCRIHWVRTAHLIKAGGTGYGLLSLLVPLMFGGVSNLWPIVAFLILCTIVDAVTLAESDTIRPAAVQPAPPKR